MESSMCQRATSLSVNSDMLCASEADNTSLQTAVCAASCGCGCRNYRGAGLQSHDFAEQQVGIFVSIDRQSSQLCRKVWSRLKPSSSLDITPPAKNSSTNGQPRRLQQRSLLYTPQAVRSAITHTNQTPHFILVLSHRSSRNTLL